MRISLDKAYKTKDGYEVILRKYERKDDSYSGVILLSVDLYKEGSWCCFGHTLYDTKHYNEDLVEVEEE